MDFHVHQQQLNFQHIDLDIRSVSVEEAKQEMELMQQRNSYYYVGIAENEVENPSLDVRKGRLVLLKEAVSTVIKVECDEPRKVEEELIQLHRTQNNCLNSGVLTNTLNSDHAYVFILEYKTEGFVAVEGRTAVTHEGMFMDLDNVEFGRGRPVKRLREGDVPVEEQPDKKKRKRGRKKKKKKKKKKKNMEEGEEEEDDYDHELRVKCMQEDCSEFLVEKTLKSVRKFAKHQLECLAQSSTDITPTTLKIRCCVCAAGEVTPQQFHAKENNALNGKYVIYCLCGDCRSKKRLGFKSYVVVSSVLRNWEFDPQKRRRGRKKKRLVVSRVHVNSREIVTTNRDQVLTMTLNPPIIITPHILKEQQLLREQKQPQNVPVEEGDKSIPKTLEM